LGAQSVTIRVDGEDRPVLTGVGTVREALDEAGVTVGPDDRVEPDLYVELRDGMTIHVIRLQQEIIVERETVPYRQQTIKSEALAAGEQRLLQAGKNGEVEVTYRVQFEDGVEVSRSIIQRVVIAEAATQITVVGVEGVTDSVEIPGTIAYLNNGNAWVMRVNSGGRHLVTSEGNLDGHVFALSPDGTYLLYTVPTDTVEYDGTFNELYVLNVVVLDQEPQKLPVVDALWADWSPDGRQIAYSTGVKSGPPGWKANNDLWVASVSTSRSGVKMDKAQRIVRPQASGAYSWWGAEYAWSPDSRKVAYARPDQVGWIDVRARRVFPLAPFAPLDTHSDWIWVPTPTWSPDSSFIACTIHGPEPGRADEESQQFEIWALDLEGKVRARLTRAVGMWSTPRWSPAQDDGSTIAYAEAIMPFSSHDSRYTLKTMDRDGSNKRAIFATQGQTGVAPPIANEWSPDGEQLVVLYQGDLYLLEMGSGRVQRLTGDGQCSQLDWAS
jgi:Tol biopolymer transport system component